jgi:hypothetical protein
MVRCICIDSKNRPHEIPKSMWIKTDELYKITHIFYHPNQGIQGVSIYEKPLDETCAPYESFRLSRFAILIEDLDKFIELIKSCTDLNDVQIEELMTEIEFDGYLKNSTLK